MQGDHYAKSRRPEQVKNAVTPRYSGAHNKSRWCLETTSLKRQRKLFQNIFPMAQADDMHLRGPLFCELPRARAT
jgi:hypothetical protein